MSGDTVLIRLYIYILYICFVYFPRVSSRIAHDVGSSGGKKADSVVLNLLPAIAVFADWIGEHPQYLKAPPAPPSHPSPSHPTHNVITGGYSDDAWREDSTTVAHSAFIIYADSELLRAEGRARSAMKANLMSIKDICLRLSSSSSSSSSSSRRVRVPLQEHFELRGFGPIESFYEGVRIHRQVFFFFFFLNSNIAT